MNRALSFIAVTAAVALAMAGCSGEPTTSPSSTSATTSASTSTNASTSVRETTTTQTQSRSEDQPTSSPATSTQVTGNESSSISTPAPQGERLMISGNVIEPSYLDYYDGPGPNGEAPDDTMYILVFDQPADITGWYGGQQVTRTVSYGFLGANNQYGDQSATWGPYVGQHITISVVNGEVSFPTGMDIPEGMINLGYHGQLES